MFGNVFVCFHLVQRQEEGGEIQEKIQDSPQKLQQRQEVSEHYSVRSLDNMMKCRSASLQCERPEAVTLI